MPLGWHAIGTAWGGMGWDCIGVTCHWGGMPFGRHGRHGVALHWGGMALGRHGAAWGGIVLGRHAIGKAWGGMPLGWHGAALHLGGNAHRRQCIKNPAFTNPALIGASQLAGITKSSIVKFGNYTGGKTPYCIHSGGKTPCMKISKIWHCQMPAITLAAKHLGENIKHLALTNLAFTGASHLAGITKSGIAKFWQ
jgi:hypothetical protein